MQSRMQKREQPVEAEERRQEVGIRVGQISYSLKSDIADGDVAGDAQFRAGWNGADHVLGKTDGEKNEGN